MYIICKVDFKFTQISKFGHSSWNNLPTVSHLLVWLLRDHSKCYFLREALLILILLFLG